MTPDPERGLADQVFDRLIARSRQALREPGEPLGAGEAEILAPEDAELEDDEPPGGAIPALFARGCRQHLERLEQDERPSCLRRVAHDLARLEGRAPQGLLAALRRELSQPQLQLLTEAMAADLARDANASWRGSTEGTTWLLEQLLGAAGEDSSLVAPGGQSSLLRRAELLLQESGDRWIVLRRLAAECDNVWLLRYLFSSPALFGPDELAVRLLARGSHRHVSCGLYALHLAPGRALEVSGALIEELEGQGPAAACSRVLDIYAQLWLNGGEPEVLRATLLRWLAARLRADEPLPAGAGRAAPGQGGWLPALVESLDQGPRMLRQVFLLADLAELLRPRSPRHAALLHHAVLRLFCATFTPAGVRHPLMDSLWRSRVGDALAEMMDLYPELAERLEALGLGLPLAAARWLDGATRGQGGGELAELATLFLRLFGGTLSHAARELWRRMPRSATALRCYRALARVLAAHRDHAAGAGTFGALEHLLPLEGADRLSDELLGNAAIIDLRAQDHARTGRRRVRWLPVSLRDELGASGMVSMPSLPLLSESELWNGQPVWARRLRRSPGRGALSTLLGLDALLLLLRLPLRLLGHERQGELLLEGNQLVLREATRLLGVRFRLREQRLPLEGLRIERQGLPPAQAVRLVGWLVLTTGAVLGTLMTYTGLETGLTGNALAGAGLIFGSLLYDASCHHRYLSATDEALLLLTPLGRSAPLSLLLGREQRERVAARLGRAG